MAARTATTANNSACGSPSTSPATAGPAAAITGRVAPKNRRIILVPIRWNTAGDQ